MRSARKTTDGRDAGYRFRRVGREDSGTRWRRVTGVLFGPRSPVVVGIEATGAMQWFLEWMEELGIECRVGDPAKIRAAEPRKQKNDRRDAQLLLKLLSENRFPTIWMPSTEQRDLRTLLRHRHQWVTDANSRPAHVAIDGTQSRSQARPLTMEPSGPASIAGVAAGSSRQRAPESTDDVVPLDAGIDRRTGSRSEPASPKPSWGAAVNDASGSRADHSVSHRSVLG